MGFIDRLMKKAEDMAKLVMPTDTEGNETYYHPEQKKYFRAPKI